MEASVFFFLLFLLFWSFLTCSLPLSHLLGFLHLPLFALISSTKIHRRFHLTFGPPFAFQGLGFVLRMYP
jgi:hypothetical protein